MYTVAEKILKGLFEMEIRYKGGTRASLAQVFEFFSGNKNTFRSTISRLRNKGFIDIEGGGWIITKSGREYLSKDNLKTFSSPFEKSAKKDLLLMFDVPEECRHYRDWLREQLKEFGYTMIQQSVWAGPSPLPKEFKDYIKKLKLQKTIRTFKLAKGINLK